MGCQPKLRSGYWAILPRGEKAQAEISEIDSFATLCWLLRDSRCFLWIEVSIFQVSTFFTKESYDWLWLQVLQRNLLLLKIQPSLVFFQKEMYDFFFYFFFFLISAAWHYTGTGLGNNRFHRHLGIQLCWSLVQIVHLPQEKVVAGLCESHSEGEVVPTLWQTSTRSE